MIHAFIFLIFIEMVCSNVLAQELNRKNPNESEITIKGPSDYLNTPFQNADIIPGTKLIPAIGNNGIKLFYLKFESGVKILYFENGNSFGVDSSGLRPVMCEWKLQKHFEYIVNLCYPDDIVLMNKVKNNINKLHHFINKNSLTPNYLDVFLNSENLQRDRLNQSLKKEIGIDTFCKKNGDSEQLRTSINLYLSGKGKFLEIEYNDLDKTLSVARPPVLLPCPIKADGIQYN